MDKCSQRKLEIFTKGRKARNFARLDSLLRETKEKHISPSEPAVQRLMAEKFALEQKMMQNYRISPEGKRCTALEEKRRRWLDSALSADPDYPKWKGLAEPGPMPQ